MSGLPRVHHYSVMQCGGTNGRCSSRDQLQACPEAAQKMRGFPESPSPGMEASRRGRSFEQQIKTEKGLWQFQTGKFAILHKEVERLDYEFGIETDVETKYADLPKGCAIVKATAIYQGKKFTSLGEVSPANNNFIFPVSIC